MAAINDPQPPNPPNSADKAARKILKTHVSSAGTKPLAARTSSNGSTASRIAGSRVGGGGKVRGGKG